MEDRIFSIPYGKQQIVQADIDAVVEALLHPYLTTGPRVREFEQSFANYIGCDFAIAVSNGTAALHLSALAIGVNNKSKVITTPITFAASANCVLYCGGQVEFCDIEPTTKLLDIEKVRAKLASEPDGTYQGLIPVDFAGYPIDMEAFKELADEYGLWIIEDACHAPGGWFKDSRGTHQRCGNGAYADLAIFSFHPVKHIACGEGGMITTNDENLYHKLLQLRSHGMIYQGNSKLYDNHGGWYMELQELGYNYRIPDILCALGTSQLKRADEGLAKRRKIAKKYDQAFQNSGVETIVQDTKVAHAYHLYVIEVDNRKSVYDFLRSKGIYCQIHYIPIHYMPYYQKLGFKKGSLPIAENYYERCISLPMFPSLTSEEQNYVIEQVLACTNSQGKFKNFTE